MRCYIAQDVSVDKAPVVVETCQGHEAQFASIRLSFARHTLESNSTCRLIGEEQPHSPHVWDEIQLEREAIEHVGSLH